MVRVSDEEIQMVINDMDGEWELDEQFALDLRDARALLRMAAEFIEDCDDSDARRRRGPDMLERIRQHLEGYDG